MEALMGILKWFKGAKISINIGSIDVGIEIGTNGTAKISAEGKIDDLVDFIKGLKGEKKKAETKK